MSELWFREFETLAKNEDVQYKLVHRFSGLKILDRGKGLLHYWFCWKAISDANFAKATFSFYNRGDDLTCSKIDSARYQDKKLPKYSIFKIVGTFQFHCKESIVLLISETFS